MSFRENILFGVLFCITIYSGYMLCQTSEKYQISKEYYEELQLQAETAVPNRKLKDIPIDQLTNTMRKINPDYIAWIKIEGTPVDYPIAAESAKTDYLTHDFSGNKNFYGCLFTAQGQPFSEVNTVIYGHNMKNGEMFGSLKKYLTQSYFEEHPIITVNHKGRELKYQIISVQLVHAGNHDLYNFKTDNPNYIQKLIDSSLIQTFPVSINENRILTLSTCYQTSKRLLVLAIKLPD